MIAAMNSTSGYTTYRGQEFTGTSAATPVAAGLGALILSAHKGETGFTNADALKLMKDTAVDLGSPGFDNLFGWGRINMAAAIPDAPAEGDANTDGKVNNLDLGVVKQKYGIRQGHANYTNAADCNHDGVIDELDVFVIGRNFSD
jgi:subtilisin family serine protease